MRRQRALAETYDTFYRDAGARPGWCYYCGERAGTMDHVPPLSMTHAVGPSVLARAKIPLLRVPACHECNNALNALAIIDLHERRAHMAEWLQRRYAKALQTGQWSDEELDALGPSLRGLVNAAQVASDTVRRRITFATTAPREVSPAQIDLPVQPGRRRSKLNESRTCGTCGTAFTALRGWAEFCSSKCRSVHFRAQQRKQVIRDYFANLGRKGAAARKAKRAA